MVSAKKNIFQKILCVMFSLITVFSSFTATGISASAAVQTTTYTVVTKANYWYPGSESITIKQSKEQYYSNWKKTKTKKRNMQYTVKCVPVDWSGKKPKTIEKTFSGSSIKIDLSKNVTYKVTITASPIPYGNFGVVKQGYPYISGAHKATYY